MKLKCWIIGLAMLAVIGQVEAREINILFMGNSYTVRHNLPELVKKVFEEGQPGLTVNVERIAYGGQDMFRHHDFYFTESFVRLNSITIPEINAQISIMESLLKAGGPPTFLSAYYEKTGLKPVVWETIEKYLGTAVKNQKQLIERVENNGRVKWDYIVLQSWRDVVADVDAGYAEYAQKWAKMAEKEGIKVILYITAPHAQNQEPVTEPVELAQTAMELITVRQLVARIHPYAVVPVALGLKNIQMNGTDLKFRYINDGHPNQYGAFLTSNMFYAAFFRQSTEGFYYNRVTETKLKDDKTPDGGAKTVIFDRATKTLLQKAAYDAVMEFNAGLGH
jgi:hypothetical protein